MSKFGVVILTFAFESNYEWQKKNEKKEKRRTLWLVRNVFLE